MPDQYVPVCDQSGSFLTDGVNELPQCPSGHGSWVLLPQSMWDTTVDYDQATKLWSAIIGVLVVAYAIKIISRTIRGRK